MRVSCQARELLARGVWRTNDVERRRRRGRKLQELPQGRRGRHQGAAVVQGKCRAAEEKERVAARGVAQRAAGGRRGAAVAAAAGPAVERPAEGRGV
jgi:hypothetical protein